MQEREAMAILVSATADDYARRTAALLGAGSALGVVENPEDFCRELGEAGVAALREAVARRDELLEALDRAGVHLLLRGEAGYPERLAQIPDAPHLLYVQGAADCNDELPIAIVGTRRANPYGLRHTHEMARELAQAGACIVSGLALGIDAQAHEGALDADGRTIAVLGGGLDCFYPRENLPLYERILDHGGSVVTEYPMGVAPEGNRFLLRNRIIAGISAGVVVTQGPHRSGAHRTASDAAEYGRDVFALPGSVDDPCSQLPHKLIGEGAQIATCAADVLSALAPERVIKKTPKPKKKREPVRKEPPAPKAAPPVAMEEMTPEERAIMQALSEQEMEYDALCERTGIDAAELGALLMSLEMEGLICALPGLRYARA